MTRSESISSIDDVAISQSAAHIRSSSVSRTVECIEGKREQDKVKDHKLSHYVAYGAGKKRDKEIKQERYKHLG